MRDTGKALGIGNEIVERVAKSFHYWSGKKEILEKINENGLPAHTRQARLWAMLADTLKGFPRHLSQHPGGFVIARDKLSRLVPIENAAMPGRSVVQWDKDDLDAMGLLKVDVLALGMLSALQRGLQLVSRLRGRPFALQDIPRHDESTFEMIRRADTIGVFQIESRAQMSMLPRMQPRHFYDLVIQVAIVRPGPIQGGMVRPYLGARQSPPNANTPSSDSAQIFALSLGVRTCKKQTMTAAALAAAISPDYADEPSQFTSA